MIKKVKNIIFFIFLAGTLWSNKLSPALEEVYHIDLNIYDGIGSLLLHWPVPDEIEIKEVNVFRKAGSKSDFTLNANISSGEISNNRFIDINCKNNIRYFYYVEVIDADNNIYKSDHLKPSFGSIKKGNIQKIKLEQTALELFKNIIRSEIIEDNTGINVQSVDALINLMSSEVVDIDLWVEKFHLNAIDDVSLLFDSEKKYYFEDDILMKFQNNEQLYRNHFLLTPEEWKSETKNIFTTAKNNWFLLKDSFQDYVKVINSLSPIIILGANNKNNKTLVELLVVNNSELDQNDVKLSFFDEQIIINKKSKSDIDNQKKDYKFMQDEYNALTDANKMLSNQVEQLTKDLKIYFLRNIELEKLINAYKNKMNQSILLIQKLYNKKFRNKLSIRNKKHYKLENLLPPYLKSMFIK